MFARLRQLVFGSGNGSSAGFAGRAAGSSKSLAKSRLHFVLVQDRTGLSAEDLASFKREMLSVIEKYFVVDEKGFDISYKRDTDMTTLVINSPIVVRRQDTASHQVGTRRLRRRRRHHGRITPPTAAAGEVPPTPTSQNS